MKISEKVVLRTIQEKRMRKFVYEGIFQAAAQSHLSRRRSVSRRTSDERSCEVAQDSGGIELVPKQKSLKFSHCHKNI